MTKIVEEEKELDKDNKFYTCKYDRVFKEVFMNEKNNDILASLLECILNVKIKEIEYPKLERDSDNNHILCKPLDLDLETDTGRQEIAVSVSHDKCERSKNINYYFKKYSYYVLKSDRYDPKTIITLINFNYDSQDAGCIKKYTMRDKNGKQYVENFIIYEVNMSACEKIWDNKDIDGIKKNKYLVMLFLKDKELTELIELLTKDNVVGEYMEELKRLNQDPKFREYMSIEEDNHQKIS